ncbi:MAG: NAD(P)/FAD-dependent oxidoreductase, partial [Verrucomicrobiales bacterium]
RVAGGLMTPITGMRMVKSWRIDETWPVARDFYRGIESELGASFFHQLAIARIFRSQQEAGHWARRRDDAAFASYLEEDPLVVAGNGEPAAPFGGFAMRRCGWVDLGVFLERSRAFFEAEGAFSVGEFDEEALDPAAPEWEGVRVEGAVIHCAGHEARFSRFFDWVPFKPAKGEILTVELDPAPVLKRILNCGNWLLPLGGGRFRTGTTYCWDDLDPVPTQRARQTIEAGLREIVGERGVRVTRHVAGVRPIIRESKVLFGRHPAHPRLGFFNGLGSKGVLNAPFFAERFAAHLVDGVAIEEEVDLRRNF